MSTLAEGPPLLEILSQVSLRALFLAAVAYSLVRLLQPLHPAFEHRAWVGVLLGMLALPALYVWLPDWTLPLPGIFESQSVKARALQTLPLPSAAAGEPWRSPGAPLPAPPALAAPTPGPLAAKHGWRWGEALLALYGSGVLLMAARLALGWTLTRRLVAEANPLGTSGLGLEIPPRLRLRIHPRVLVPVCTGWLRPALLLPPAWDHWCAEKQRAVLAHELEHVRRRDYLVQLLAALNRSLYWFHPLAWWLPRRLTLLAERSCDEAVARSGESRRTYAGHLLDVARALKGEGRRALPNGVAMAQPRHLERRLHALLTTRGAPCAPSRPVGLLLSALLGLGALAAASLALEPRPAPEPPRLLEAPRQAVAGGASLSLPEQPGPPAPALETAATSVPLAPEPTPEAVVAPAAPPRAPEPSSAPETAADPPAAGVIAPADPVPAPEAPTAFPWGVRPALARTSTSAAPRADEPGRAPARKPDHAPRPEGPPTPPTPAEVAPAASGSAAQPRPATASRTILLFFDDEQRSYIRKPRLSREAAGHARRWVREGMREGDRVAVLSYWDGLRLHQDLTSDRKALLRALAEVKRWRAHTVRPASGPGSSLLSGLPEEAELGSRSRDVVEALELLSRAAGGIAGAKHLLLFTAGFNREPNFLASLAAEMRRGGIVVHTLDMMPPGTYQPLDRLGGARALALRTGGDYTTRTESSKDLLAQL